MVWAWFYDSFVKIIDAMKIIMGLDDMAEHRVKEYDIEWDAETKARARNILQTLETSTFLVTFVGYFLHMISS